MGISPRALSYYLAKYPCIDEADRRLRRGRPDTQFSGDGAD
jgi:hypothetical protein